MTLFPQPIINPRAISSAATANPGDYLNVSGATTVTLPPVATGGVVQVRKVDAALTAVTIKTADGSTIDGVAGTTGIATAATAAAQHTGFTVASDGSNWWVIGT